VASYRLTASPRGCQPFRRLPRRPGTEDRSRPPRWAC